MLPRPTGVCLGLQIESPLSPQNPRANQYSWGRDRRPDAILPSPTSTRFSTLNVSTPLTMRFPSFKFLQLQLQLQLYHQHQLLLHSLIFCWHCCCCHCLLCSCWLWLPFILFYFLQHALPSIHPLLIFTLRHIPLHVVSTPNLHLFPLLTVFKTFHTHSTLVDGLLFHSIPFHASRLCTKLFYVFCISVVDLSLATYQYSTRLPFHLISFYPSHFLFYLVIHAPVF